MASFIKSGVLKNHFKTIISERIERNKVKFLQKCATIIFDSHLCICAVAVFALLQTHMLDRPCKDIPSYSVKYGRSWRSFNLRSGSEKQNSHIISADCEFSVAEASLFGECKGKHCAQHVFLMKTSVLRRTSLLYRKTWS